MIFVEDTAAESPAASASGTVKPSAHDIADRRRSGEMFLHMRYRGHALSFLA